MEATIYGLGFPQIRDTFLGFPNIRSIIFLGLNRVPRFRGTTIYPATKPRKNPAVLQYDYFPWFISTWGPSK